MKKYLYIALAVVTISCGKISPKGDIENKDIELSEFSKVDLKGKFRVFYVQSPHNFVNVETYPNISNNLKIDVKNNQLSIREKRETDKVDFYNITIYGKNSFNDVKLADSVEMNISSQMKVDNFSLQIRDNAKFIGSVLSDKAKIDMTGKSRANLLGKTNSANVIIKDTASIISPFWFIQDLTIDSKNGNFAEFNVNQEIKGKITNTAKLMYIGDPTKKITITEKALLEKSK